MEMGEVRNIEEAMPHVVISSYEKVHVIPARFFERVASREVSFLELDDWGDILPVIIGEWLSLMD
jgi:hypothetical protein